MQRLIGVGREAEFRGLDFLASSWIPREEYPTDIGALYTKCIHFSNDCAVVSRQVRRSLIACKNQRVWISDFPTLDPDDRVTKRRRGNRAFSPDSLHLGSLSDDGPTRRTPSGHRSSHLSRWLARFFSLCARRTKLDLLPDNKLFKHTRRERTDEEYTVFRVL